MYQKSIKHVSYDSLRPNERAGTKKFCKKILSYIDPLDNCVAVPPKTNLDIKRQKISQLQNFKRYFQSHMHICRYIISTANVTE